MHGQKNINIYIYIFYVVFIVCVLTVMTVQGAAWITAHRLIRAASKENLTVKHCMLYDVTYA